ncbi:hypothetical protein Tco_0801431 [Tanacetum coccineum]|uniref:Uncharacterized protein n=1 Tax=Tanacetum coccineum TaxID=301880 RepID=A0ABQ5A0B0_9ASTR
MLDAYGQSLKALPSQPAASGSESHLPGVVVQEQDGRVNSYSEVLIGGNPQGECHVNMKKAQGMGIFTLESLLGKAQGVTITDCHAGNLCVHICDPTSQSKDPMIGINKGWR